MIRQRAKGHVISGYFLESVLDKTRKKLCSKNRKRVMILDNELRQEITVLGGFQSLMNELLKLISERNNLPLCLVLRVLDDRTEALDTDGAINRAAEPNS
ncbi:9659_t:CDS:2 [Ambispora gerdemannii]|uniref:9659_t:CDS:1 n=1 Tax=Ambispora gerdemannii TaxID=144530 RepID=A0A9N9H2P6_9GLOM|nr:9659_t:CDS:2 [Ambispora gerdemannii]